MDGLFTLGELLMLAEIAWHKLFEMPQLAIVFACLLTCLIPTVGILAYYWYKVQKVRAECELKQTLVERGLPADEIERIIQAESPASDH